jgi:hypothetical protein
VAVSGKLVSRDQRLHLYEFVERALNGDDLSSNVNNVVSEKPQLIIVGAFLGEGTTG